MHTARTGCSHTLWGFDAARLARTIEQLRRERSMSTRELAARAGISQSYVVALERARRAGATGPTPTVDVAARLAEALGVEPTVLVDASLRRSGQHVLLVLDGAARSATGVARRLAPDVGDWVRVGSERVDDGTVRIDLGTRDADRFDPDLVTRSLARQLRTIHADDAVGLVFADTSSVMSRLADPAPLLAFEHAWGAAVARAAWSAGTHAAYNVCVYELDAVRRLDDPLGAAIDLVRSHDEVWTAHGARVSTGRSGALELLRRLRPTTASATGWRARSAALLDDLAACG